MSGDWIKIRVWLARDPKVIRMADYLAGERAFINWACDPVRKGCNEHVYEHLTRDIVVSVVVRGLVQVWGVAREDGHRGGAAGDALVLPKTCLDTLDEIAGYPCFGEALAAAGWAEYDEEQDQVTLPKFFVRNHDTDELRKQRDRDRKRQSRSKPSGTVRGQAAADVRGKSKAVRGKSPPRGEERRGREKHSSSAAEEECKEELPQKEVCPEPAADGRSGPPPLLVFPTVGKGPKEWNLTEAKLAEYQESFPGADVLAECRKARQWCVDNPTKRKTARGLPAFLTRWLGKAQDSGRAPGAPAPRKSRESARQEVIDQWLQARQNTPPGSSTTPTASDSATPTPPS